MLQNQEKGLVTFQNVAILMITAILTFIIIEILRKKLKKRQSFFNSRQNFDKQALQRIETEQATQSKLQTFNYYLRDNIYHKPVIDIIQILNEIKRDEIVPNIQTFYFLMKACLQRNMIQKCDEIYVIVDQTFPSLLNDDPMLLLIYLQSKEEQDIYQKLLKESQRVELFQTAIWPQILKFIQNSSNEQFAYEKIEDQLLFHLNQYVFRSQINLTFEMLQQLEKENNLTQIIYLENQFFIKQIKNRDLEEIAKNHDMYFNQFQLLIRRKPAPGNRQRNNAQPFFPIQKFIKWDETSLNILIDASFKIGDFKRATLIFTDFFPQLGLVQGIITYGIMIKGFGSCKQYEGVVWMHDLMIKQGVQLNQIALGCIIDACARCNHLDKAEEIVRDAQQQKGVEPNVKINTIVYTTLLQGYTKQKNFAKAESLLQQMKQQRETFPNTISYNSLLQCAVQCRQFTKMKQLYYEITEKPPVMAMSEITKPDIITHSTYIKGLCKCNQLIEALQIFNELRDSKQHQLDEVLYNSLLDGLIKSGNYKQVDEIFQKMSEDQIPKSNITYSILVQFFSAQGQVEEALAVLDEMKANRLVPGQIVYTCCIQACIKFQFIDHLMPLYQEMVATKVQGDGVFYNTLISGLMFNGLIQDAVNLTQKTFSDRIYMNEQVYNNLLKTLCRNFERQKNSNHYKQSSGSSTANASNIKLRGETQQVGQPKQRFRAFDFPAKSNDNRSSAAGGMNQDEIEKALIQIYSEMKAKQIQIDQNVNEQVTMCLNQDSSLKHFQEKQYFNQFENNYGTGGQITNEPNPKKESEIQFRGPGIRFIPPIPAKTHEKIFAENPVIINNIDPENLNQEILQNQKRSRTMK